MDAGSFSRQLAIASGDNYTVDFLLSSEADTLSGGSAYSSGLLSFQVAAVPEVSTSALMLLGLAVVIGARRCRALGAGWPERSGARLA
jgi:hypothetical protein